MVTQHPYKNLATSPSCWLCWIILLKRAQIDAVVQLVFELFVK